MKASRDTYYSNSTETNQKHVDGFRRCLHTVEETKYDQVENG
jgi:hypothetical protein